MHIQQIDRLKAHISPPRRSVRLIYSLSRTGELALALVAFLFFALSANPVIAERFSGTVIAVSDGDTVRVLSGDKEVKVRLANIDAPELGQPYGQKSKKMLSDLVFQKNVEVEWAERDRYRRIVGTVYIGQWSINAKMVVIGGAWVYRKYSNERYLLELESVARKRKYGLWGLQPDQIMPPWEWRRKKKALRIIE